MTRISFGERLFYIRGLIRRRYLMMCLQVTLFCVASVVQVFGDEITTPIVIANSAAEGATLGIPRWKGYISNLDPNTIWVSYASSATSAGSMTYSTDGGDTWSTEVIQIAGNGWLDMHLSLFGKDGELYFTYPGVYFRKFNAPARSNDDRGDLINLGGTTESHRSNVTVQDNGRIWVFTRRGSYPAENVLYQYSDNNGDSWTSGVACATGTDNVRIGSMPYINGNAALIILHLADSRGYEYYIWNGSAFEAKADYSIYPVNMGQSRAFTHNVINGTTMHLIFGYGNSLYHVWKDYNNGTGTWNSQIIEESDYTTGNEWTPTSAVRGTDLYVFYCRKSSSDGLTSKIYYMRWSQISKTWSEPALVSTISGDTYDRNPNTCFMVPSTADYIPVFWTSGMGPYQIYFSKIKLDSASLDTIPPGAVNDLGAVPGPGTDEVTLAWTAPGDDLQSGTGDHYAVKYSTLTIDELSWESATPCYSAPVPSPAGSHETCIVDGLQEGMTYYFALKSYDNAGNDSPLSNVAVSKLSLDVADENGDGELPELSRICGVYPNPFNLQVKIDFSISSFCCVDLSIYDILGRKIRTLVDGFKSAGYYSLAWDGTADSGKIVSSGIYLCHMKTGRMNQVRKIVLAK
jgi:hypothetical protein